MLRLYCPACQLRFSAAGAGAARGECPRCNGRVPTTRAVEANTWLASTVLAELRASRDGRSATRAHPRGGLTR